MRQFQKDSVIQDGVHTYTGEENYVLPSPEVVRRLEWFQDQKLALMVHMGLYCQIGTVASWGLSDEDAVWSRKDFLGKPISGEEYRKMYFGLNASFNPVRFDPEEWAELAAENGFRYLIFTAKHHDGFCLWDTRETDYKTTDSSCPYSVNTNADIVRSVFNAFRKKGLGIAVYFSKPDWHSPYYWAEGMEHSRDTWRMTSYQPQDHPEIWTRFVQYTHNQILELTTQYGDVDILWLDGGQVRPETGLDIRLAEVMEKVRRQKPELIVADRTVGGAFENYVTPEQTVPDRPLTIPWESSISLGQNYSYRYHDTYKSPETILRLLIDVVCKGGNLALNISPQPDGRLPEQGIAVMKYLGGWLEKFGEAVYGTRICFPYKKGNVAFTQKQGKVYAFYMTKEGRSYDDILIPYLELVTRVSLLNTGEAVPFCKTEEGLRVSVNGLLDTIAFVFCLEK